MSEYVKKITDDFGDALNIVGDDGLRRVYVSNTALREASDLLRADYAYTPEQARKFAKALKNAADLAEGTA